jgi:tetratricopeptide (TPR) repeat protein
MMEQNRQFDFWICVVLVIATIAAYEPVRFNDFVNYDDDIYVTENPHVKNGLTGRAILWAFTTSHANNWHPLTWLSHILDCQLFGLKPLGHHLTSLFFHVLNTVLLFLVFKTMTDSTSSPQAGSTYSTSSGQASSLLRPVGYAGQAPQAGRVWPSAFVAAVFAVHPIHVESVAWVAERKDVLSGFFWILTMAAYVRYARQPSLRRYLLVAAAMGLGLMSKPMLVTMPFVLLLLDYWPLERIQWRAEINGGTSQQPPKSVKSFYRRGSFWTLVVEKIPLFIMSGIFSVITVIVQHKGKVYSSGETVPIAVPITNAPLIIRISNALVSYVRYIEKIFYPKGLSVLYPHPSLSLPRWQAIVSLLILAVITVVILLVLRSFSEGGYAARKHRYLAMGWLWYLGTLVPVIGLMQVGAQAMADRYTYLPSIGIFIMVAWGVSEAVSKLGRRSLRRKASCGGGGGWRYGREAIAIAAAAIAVLILCTRVQVRYWRDSTTLFEHALAVTENNFIMHNLLGIELVSQGQLDKAQAHFEESLLINPGYLAAHYNKGRVLIDKGKYDEAISVLSDIVHAKENWPAPGYYLGVAYAQKGDYKQAVKCFEAVVQQMPDHAGIHHDLGLAYLLLGKYDLAVRNLKEAVRLDPNYAGAAGNLAAALEEQKNAGQKGKP